MTSNKPRMITRSMLGDVAAERDAAVARAEQAERERDQAVEACALFQRDMHKWRERAEAAEARVREVEAEAAVDPVEAKARVEADRRYSGEPNHAFIEGAVWASRHVSETEDDCHVDQ